MLIVIVGAGAVGTHLAERLSAEGQDVVLIDSDPRRAQEMRERIDALVITGNGASRSILTQAGVESADLLIAVSSNDGANILAAHSGRQLGVRKTIARVSDPGLREGLTDLDVDVVIDPEESAAQEIVGLISQGGVSELIEFGRGQLALVGGRPDETSPLVGHPLSTLRRTVNGFDWVATAVVRAGSTIVAHGDTEIQVGDHVLLMVHSEHIEAAKALMGINRRDIRRALVMGTTRVAELTAEYLIDAGHDVVMVDPDVARCRQMAERHGRALIVTGDPTDPEVLSEFQIGDDDAVIALTGLDPTNILTALVAKALGAATTVARVNRLSYVGLISGFGIDATVSVRLAAANSILRFVRRGKIHSVVTFNDTDAEVIEMEVDAASEAVGKTLAELPLPAGAVIGGIMREGDAMVPTGETEIQPRDHLIIFTLPQTMSKVEGLFG
jgi:trk system potassium uptake protein TrkA